MHMKDLPMKIGFAAAAVGAGLMLANFPLSFAGAAERTVLTPAPKIDLPAKAGSDTAVFAGGCFWGMEAVFSHLKGVTSVTSGYAGGTKADANYDAVSSESTRHAEAVRVTFNPAQISYGTLMRVYFSVAHNPTELNRQGPDSGTSYRSAIFPQTPDQARLARAYIGQLAASKVWGAPIVTKLESGQFFAAEAYHQDFAVKNPYHPYIRAWDAPKVAALQKTFPNLWRAQPVG